MQASPPLPKRLLLGVVLACLVYFLAGLLPIGVEQTYGARMAAAITVFVATCWLSQALPLAAASLLPCLMPLLGVMPIGRSAIAYAHPIIWMFFGGFVLAIGIERWNLHRRIALRIIQRVGCEPRRLVLGFMLACGFLSMWLNNTSTTLMLLPIALALIHSMSASGALKEQDRANFAFALLIGIAYAASIGGTGTPIGTAPNALFLSSYAALERSGAPPVTFATWMMVAVPMVVILIPVVWWLLTRVLAPIGRSNPQASEVLSREAQSLAPIDRAECSMLGLFLLAALLWTTRRDLDLGSWLTIPGWWRLLPVPDAEFIGDGAVAIFVALLSFLLPSGRAPKQALMDWSHAQKLPWDILFLIGGSIAIADAI
ncbi:MAG: SLC13 family permease [Myxococcota bacterium]